MLKKIELMDTTLRDGEQTNNVSFSLEEKLHISKILLEKLNVDRIEVASARTSKGEQKALKAIIEWAKKDAMHSAFKRIEVLGFVDECKSVDWIRAGGGCVLNLLIKGSLNHLKNQLRKTPDEHHNEVQKVIEYAQSHNFIVNVYLEDFSNGYRNNKNYVWKTIQFLCSQKISRIMLPDTLGILYPKDVYECINEIKTAFPEQHFDFHPHNDYGLATANVLEAVRAGVDGVHTTVNCLGERTGNAPLAQVVAGIHDHLSSETGVRESQLYSISRIVETFSGKRLSANEPIVGEDAFTQTAGIHADGDKKGDLYKSTLAPLRFGRKHSYALGKLSGKASLEQNLKKLGIEMSDKNLKRVLTRIIELGDQKKIVTTEDIPFIIADVLKLSDNRKIQIHHLAITSGKNISPICSMAINYKKIEYKVTGDGDGGYDSFMNALKKWSVKIKIKIPELIDYEIRIPPGGKTSALVECKITWKHHDQKIIITRGVDSDQLLAAVYATEKMLNLIL